MIVGMTLEEITTPQAYSRATPRRSRRAVKVSTTLPERDVDFIERYTIRNNLPNRAAAYQAAVRALRHEDLMRQYEEADKEWYESGEVEVWECTVGDGIEDEG